jgi:hypothetical protein
VDRVTLRATNDPDAHLRMLRVFHMLDSPASLLPLALPA